jgi:hypothetical protein
MVVEEGLTRLGHDGAYIGEEQVGVLVSRNRM